MGGLGRRCWAETSLDGPLRRALGRLGRLMARRPLPFLLLPLFATAALAYPGWLGWRAYRARGAGADMGLWAPRGSAALRSRDVVAALFPDGGYFADRTLTSPNLLLLIVSARDGASVLRPSFVRDYARLRLRLESSTRALIPNASLSYAQLCRPALSAHGCRPDPFVSIWNAQAANPPGPNGPSFFTFPVLNLSLPEYIGPLFGQVETTERGVLQSAKYVKMIFELRPVEAAALEAFGEAWGERVREWLVDEGPESSLEVRYWSGVQQKADLGLVGERTRQLLPLLAALLLLFALGSSLMLDSVLSKPWLAVYGVLTTVCGTMTAYALLFLAGVELIQIATIVPFLVLSIGVDDVFVMLNVWRGTAGSVEERLGRTLEEAGSSIAVTSVTDAAVFVLGLASEFGAVRRFCAFAAASIVCVFAFQLTSFGAALGLAGRREAAGRHALFCVRRPRPPGAARPSPLPVRLFRTFFAEALTNARLQGFLGASYLLYVSAAAYCLLGRLRLGLEVSGLVPYDSDTYAYLRVYGRAFAAYAASAEVALGPGLDYADLSTQRLLLDLAHRLGHTHHTLPADFWLSAFLSRHPGPFASAQAFHRALFQDFLSVPPFHKYTRDVRVERSGGGEGRVLASRFWVPLRDAELGTGSAAMRSVLHEVERGRSLGLGVWAVHVTFPLAEQWEAVGPSAAVSLGTAAVATLVAALLFLPSLRSCLAIGLSVVSINVGVCGGLALSGVRLDMVSLISLLLSVGISVDFAAHMTYHFHHAGDGRPETRMATALGTVGWPILQSSVSTLVGVSSVVGVGAYVSDVFVKTVLLVVLLGLYHALFLLPVLLCLLSTPSQPSTTPTTSHTSNASSSPLPPPLPAKTIAARALPELPMCDPSPPLPPAPPPPLGATLDTAPRQMAPAPSEAAGGGGGEWLDEWLHGDVRCPRQTRGRYCPYCDTKQRLVAEARRLRSAKPAAKPAAKASTRPTRPRPISHDPAHHEAYSSHWM